MKQKLGVVLFVLIAAMASPATTGLGKTGTSANPAAGNSLTLNSTTAETVNTATGNAYLSFADLLVPGSGLRDLVGIVRRRDAGADVEELPDADLGGQVPDGPAEELPVGPDVADDRRPDGDDRLRGPLVGGEVVLAA